MRISPTTDVVTSVGAIISGAPDALETIKLIVEFTVAWKLVAPTTTAVTPTVVGVPAMVLALLVTIPGGSGAAVNVIGVAPTAENPALNGTPTIPITGVWLSPDPTGPAKAVSEMPEGAPEPPLIVIDRISVPICALSETVTSTAKTPPCFGVPEIKPVPVLTERPVGNPVAVAPLIDELEIAS